MARKRAAGHRKRKSFSCYLNGNLLFSRSSAVIFFGFGGFRGNIASHVKILLFGVS